MSRPCRHPHQVVPDSRWLLGIPWLPVPARQVWVVTGEGTIPWCVADNRRAIAAVVGNLQPRLVRARLALGVALGPDGTDYLQPRWRRAHLVLSAALAEAEHRYCVADRLREQLADGYVHSRWGWSGPTTGPLGP